ncbi:MAG TPA: hypothetical protein VFN67_13450 [Polyangiales bacterium]|nr:hypothetical protein [Polyangiales bacterium]
MGARAARQLFLVGLALSLWSALGRAGWLELLGCYVAGLGLTDLLVAWLLPSLSARAWCALGVLFALPGLRFAYTARERVAEDAGLAGIGEHLRDRVRLARSPAIAPGLLSTAQPQTFFIHADAAREVSVELGAKLRLKAQAVAAGLFRLEYDPRRDGLPDVRDGDLPIRIHTDDSVASRSMQVVTPLAHPRWFCRSPSGERAATLSEETDELIVVGAATPKPARIPVGDGPIACAFVEETKIAISHRHAAELWIVDIAAPAFELRKLLMSGPLGRLVFDASHAEILVARTGVAPGIVQIAWPELSLRATSGIGGDSERSVSSPSPLSAATERAPGVVGSEGPSAASSSLHSEGAGGLRAASPAANAPAVEVDQLALCGDALILTTRADASLRRWERQGGRFVELAHVELGRPAAALAVDEACSRVIVSVTDYRPAGSAPQLGNHFVQDQLLVFDARDLDSQQRVLTARRSERQTKPGDSDQGGSPVGLWPLRDGRLGVALAGTDELWRLSLPEAEPNSLRFDVDDFYTPHGVVELADGTLWLASPAAGSLAKLAPGASTPLIVPLTPDDRALASGLPAALARRIGERGFYESTRSGISCQSCHMHADSDFAAYNLGDHRLVPTLGVSGLLGTAPYLRDGSYPRISDLDDVAQQLYRGYVRQQPGRRYALQAYVESLPRTRPWTAAQRDVRAGYAVFQRAGCERCHAPPAFTSLGQLPIAALFPKVAATLKLKERLDVPSLLSVSTSPPYLHDGRAPSLRAIFTEHNPDNLHGDTRGLNDSELSDLIHFLESL